MITTAIPTKSLDTFTLELPKDDTAFLKTIARKMGWTVKSNVSLTSKHQKKYAQLEKIKNQLGNYFFSS